MATIEEYKEELRLVEDNYAAFIRKTRDFHQKLTKAETDEARQRIIQEFGDWLYIY